MEPTITVATTLLPHEEPQRVVDSIQAIFPDWQADVMPTREEFPSDRGAMRLVGEAKSLELVFKVASKHRILDTALDAMSLDLDGDSTTFALSRQAAFAGKIAFVVNERPIGGVIDVSLIGEDLGLWLEQQTWHEGRNHVPRSVGDGYGMAADGSSTEWFNRHGRPTMNDDQD